MILFQNLLSIVEVFITHNHQLLKLYSLFIYWFWLKIKINIFFIKDAEVITRIELKKYMASICILSIIISKFSY